MNAAYTIWKYPVNLEDEFIRDMPLGARVLSVQVQRGNGPVMWVLVDPNAPKHPRKFRLTGTGHPIDRARLLAGHYKFVDTFQLADGDLVFHLFEDFPYD